MLRSFELIEVCPNCNSDNIILKYEKSKVGMTCADCLTPVGSMLIRELLTKINEEIEHRLEYVEACETLGEAFRNL